MRMDDKNAKKILLASPPADWKRQLGRPRIIHVAQHRPTGSETTPPYAPRSSRFGSEPPSVEDDVDVWHYAILELHARNDDDDDEDKNQQFLSYTLLMLDVMRPLVNSSHSRLSHCMNTSKPVAARQMRARLNPAMHPKHFYARCPSCHNHPYFQA